MSIRIEDLPVVVIGGGPIGLAAAAHLLSRGLRPVILEAADEVAGNVRTWQHVRMFSPWEYATDPAAVSLLQRHGWQAPDEADFPTGGELIEQYLAPLAATPEIQPHLRLASRVTAISRLGSDKMRTDDRELQPFDVRVDTTSGSERILARAVLDTSGTWHQPRPAGSSGLPAIGEAECAERLLYGIPDLLGDDTRYAGRRVAVIGSGHSAIQTLLALAELRREHPSTSIHWILRTSRVIQTYGGASNDELPARGALGSRLKEHVVAGDVEFHAPFWLERFDLDDAGVRITSEVANHQEVLEVDEVIVTTGSRPQFEMTRELRLDLDNAVEAPSRLAPLIDPNVHSCGTVPPHGEAELRHSEQDFYIVGSKSYGRAPTFLLRTGYEQVRSVVARLAGDHQAARRVELVLPKTGVCSSGSVASATEKVEASCC